MNWKSRGRGMHKWRESRMNCRDQSEILRVRIPGTAFAQSKWHSSCVFGTCGCCSGRIFTNDDIKQKNLVCWGNPGTGIPRNHWIENFAASPAFCSTITVWPSFTNCFTVSGVYETRFSSAKVSLGTPIVSLGNWKFLLLFASFSRETRELANVLLLAVGMEAHNTFWVPLLTCWSCWSLENIGKEEAMKRFIPPSKQSKMTISTIFYNSICGYSAWVLLWVLCRQTQSSFAGIPSCSWSMVFTL